MGMDGDGHDPEQCGHWRAVGAPLFPIVLRRYEGTGTAFVCSTQSSGVPLTLTYLRHLLRSSNDLAPHTTAVDYGAAYICLSVCTYLWHLLVEHE
jgi:hypothetical protein